MYRYIALVEGRRPEDEDTQIRHALASLGLHQRLSLGGVVLYATEATLMRRLGRHAALIGHVFPRRSIAADAPSVRLIKASPQDDVRHLIEDCWGEYILFDWGGDAPGAGTVMRDPSGGIDCVYSLRDGFFTSDVSIATELRLFRREIDWDFIRSNLVYPHHKAGRTGLAGLSELLPGCRLHVRGNDFSVEVAWSPWPFVSPEHRHGDLREAQAKVREAVASTVRRWAETDESLLLELSGGLDSSIVGACLQDTDARVACCNLITPVPGADERRYASLMADLLGVELHVERLGLDGAQIDFQPPPHTIAPSTWFLQHAANELNEVVAKRLEVRSFFSGGGGDTVFGYTRSAAPAVDAFRERGLGAGIRAVQDLAELHQCTFWKAGRLSLRKLFARPKPPRHADTSFPAL